jgi:phosphatidylinositol-3-phosphatase
VSGAGPVAFLAARFTAATAPLRIPSRPVSALLVLVFLGFGVLIGTATRSPTDTLAASARRHLKLVVPATSAASTPSASTPSPATASEAGSEEAPAAASEPTPEAAGASSGGSARTPAASRKSSTPAGNRSAPTGTSGQGGSTGSTGAAGASGSKLPPVKHVFVIMLSDQPYASVFGPSSTAPYLAHTLEQRGELLVRYYAVAHMQLAGEVALLSGQGPTAETAANCPTYASVAPATTGAEEQVAGQGCVYPAATRTLVGQLAAKQLSWRAYVEGIDEPGAKHPACAHPVLGQLDPSAVQMPFGQPYATFRDPFVYFHSVIDSSSCAARVVGLRRLSSDLAGAKRTPAFSYIVPDACHDGSSTPCASGAPAGMPAANGFLTQVVGKILASPAYKNGGLLVITVDQAPSIGPFADSSSCCGQPRFPNLPPATGAASGLRPKGGGQVGALLLSPFVKGNTTSQEPYNHFSLLRTLEDLFGVAHLGYAASPGVSSFEPSVFSAYTPH